MKKVIKRVKKLQLMIKDNVEKTIENLKKEYGKYTNELNATIEDVIIK